MTLSVALGPDTQESTQTGTAASTDALTAPDIPWNLVIWNDPVNLMSYVSYVFQSYFGYSEAKANKLMLEVHKKGRSIVAHGSKEQVEQHAVAMHGFGLWATVEKATGGSGGRRRTARARENVAKAFKYGLKGITGFLEPAERELLRSLFDDVISMLEPEDRGHEDPLAALIGLDMEAREPSDRALRRLLPNVMKNDDAASLEFRQLTERSLRESKIGALRAAALGLDKDELVLTPDDARHWSMALNDVRLVLAERLDIRDEADADHVHQMQDWSQAEDVESYLALVYNFTTWLQESLVQAMLQSMERVTACSAVRCSAAPNVTNST